MKTKHTLIGMTAALTLLAGMAHADTVSQDIQLRATVPSGKFYVKGKDGWPAETVQLGWNDNTNTLKDYTLPLVLKNSLGGGTITAQLAYDAILKDGNDTDDLPVDVSISTTSVATPVKLTTTAQKIYDDKDGKQESGNLTLHVTKTSDLAVGDYTGTVALMFEGAIKK